MAKIDISYDSVQKKVTVSLDGKKITNIESVSFHKYGDWWDAVIRTFEHDSESVLTKNTTYTSSFSEATKASINDGILKPCDIEGFVAKDNGLSSVIKEIEEYIGL